MSADWLSSLAEPAFRARCWTRQPHAAPSTASSVVPLLQWDAFDRVLASADADVLTVASGRLEDVPRPRSSDDVRRLMQRGISTVVRAGERHDAALGALAASFAAAFPGEVRFQLYATPGGTNSFGWHYDFEDVFIAQTLGTKDYFFRDNSVARHTRLGETLDFACVRDERTPLMTARLIAGDWLYLPRRWWHLVKCVDDALSISVGIMSPEELRAAHHVPPGWSQRQPDDAA